MSEDKSYKSPVAALLWSVTISGAGQLYNRDYLIGTVLLFLEIVINILSHLNMSYYLALNFYLEDSINIANLEWGLFYPSIYGFSIFQAYNRARDINNKLRLEGVPEPSQKAKGTGALFGLTIGMNLGLSWSFILGSTVSTGLSFAILGILIGIVIEKITTYYHHKLMEKKIYET